MSRSERAAAGKSQTVCAEFRELLGIPQTASVESLGREASLRSMRQQTDHRVLVAFSEGTHGKGPTPSDHFPHAGPLLRPRRAQPSHDGAFRDTVADFRQPFNSRDSVSDFSRRGP